MASTMPIAFREVLNVTQLGIQQRSIKYTNVSLQSDKFITIKEGKDQMMVVDTTSKAVSRFPIPVDSAIMNPVNKIVAARKFANGETSLIIYDMDRKQQILKSSLPAQVVYWTWTGTKMIALVSDKHVYHWAMAPNSTPTKVFARDTPQGPPVSIMNYKASADGKWLILGGVQVIQETKEIKGVLQVYSVDMKRSRPTIDAHAACFAHVTIEGRQAPSNLFCFTKPGKSGQQSSVVIMEVGVPKEHAFKQLSPLPIAQGDFPMSIVPDNKYGMLYINTRAGKLFMYEIQSGKCIFAEQATRLVAAVEHSAGGVMGLEPTGRVSHFYVDEKNIVQYICEKVDTQVGLDYARRQGLGGGDGLFRDQFNRMIGLGQIQQAIDLAASAPSLRGLETIQVINKAGEQYSIAYFKKLITSGTLNAIESVEWIKLLLARNATGTLEQIKQWLTPPAKLEASEALGDLLHNKNTQMALSVYLRAGVHNKAIPCFLSMGASEPDEKKATEHFRNVIAYAKKENFQAPYEEYLRKLLSYSSDKAKLLAVLLLEAETGPMMDINLIVRLFRNQGDVRNTSYILLKYLSKRGDREEDAALQTMLYEINLLSDRDLAKDILESEDYKFTHYDRLKIAQLCDRAGLFEQALLHYDDLERIKRVLNNTQMIRPEFLFEFFGPDHEKKLTPEQTIDCLRYMLKTSLSMNVGLVVEIAKKWSDHLGPEKLIALFEEFESYNGLFFYLGTLVNNTTDSTIVFKYIQAATKLGQLPAVEQICRKNEHYDAKEVKEFLLSQNLQDPRPLIHVCDRFGFIEELTQYLFNNNLYMFIEVYVQRMNTSAAPPVIAALLDLNASEEKIKALISSVLPPPDDPEFIGKLVDVMESKTRLKMLRPWLEDRQKEGNEDPQLHNGLAKIYVETGNNPRQFLTSNKFYDSKVVGAYCESFNPRLAFIAYKRAWGECDDQLLEVSNKHGFFQEQARYLVERQDPDLWAKVMDENNQYRRQVIDQVINTALPESTVPDEVSKTVKAFIGHHKELIELLEKLIFHGPTDGGYHTNSNLQNLLIYTAIQSDKKRVMDYIKRLDHYDGPDLAKIAMLPDYELFEEAFFIYKKFKKNEQAIEVLLVALDDMPRAVEFAECLIPDEPLVWGILAKAQLAKNLVKEAIASYIRADDARDIQDVIDAAKEQDLYQDLITYLNMARTKSRESFLDNELIYCFAKTERYADLEEFINAHTIAKMANIADRCFNEELYQAAKILYTYNKNNAKLAICLVKLEQFQEAVDAARQANKPSTWKAVCFSCVDSKKFRLAHICGMNIIKAMDHLMDLVRHYETGGYFDQLIALLEQGVHGDHAHQGIYTQLGVCYSRYREDRLLEHIKSYHRQLVIHTLLEEVRQAQQWPEAVFLYRNCNQFDNAIDTMIQHSAACWDDKLFKEIMAQVANTEVYYRAIDFYLLEHPLELNKLLIDLAHNLDHARVVHKVDSSDNLHLIKGYLLSVQPENIIVVNEAINKLLIEEEDFKALAESIEHHSAFDQMALAQKLENHELLEFRRISASLYKMNKKFDKSIAISKKDERWQDAMETTAASKDPEQAEQLLRFFVEQKNPTCFAACAYACYELIQPDVVLELSWRHGLMDFGMPFMIQSMRDTTNKLARLAEKVEANSSRGADEETKDQNNNGFNPMGMGPLALPAPPMMQPMMQPNMAMGQPMGQPMMNPGWQQ